MAGALVDEKIMMERVKSIQINLHCQLGGQWRAVVLNKYECLHEWAKALAHPRRRNVPHQ